MKKTIDDVISLSFWSGLHTKASNEVDSKYRDVAREIDRLDPDENGGIDTFDIRKAVDAYGCAVEDIVETLEQVVQIVSKLEDEGDQLLTGIGSLLKLIPMHVVLDSTCSQAVRAERWCGENAQGEYDFIEIRNALIIVFKEPDDYVLFKLKFGE